MNRSWLSLLSLLCLAVLDACSGERSQPGPRPAVLHNVPLVNVEKRTVPDVLQAVGTVRAAQTSVVAAQITGNVVEIRVHEGDRVGSGQMLAAIDPSQPRAALDRAIATEGASQQQLAAADADLALAESTLKRFELLYQRQSVSPQEFDEVRARQKAALARRDMARADQAQAKAARAQAQAMFSYTTIRAPFGGMVTGRSVDLGALATPGAPLFTIEDIRRYRLEVSVNETQLNAVRTGQVTPVWVDALGEAPLDGKVVEIVPAADPGSRSFLVKLELPADTRLRSGLYGHAEFARGRRESIMVPRSAIVERGQMQGVFVLDQNRIAGLRYVTLGKSMADDIEVLAGLQPGDRLVVAPGDMELDGKQIEAQ